MSDKYIPCINGIRANLSFPAEAEARKWCESVFPGRTYVIEVEKPKPPLGDSPQDYWYCIYRPVGNDLSVRRTGNVIEFVARMKEAVTKDKVQFVNGLVILYVVAKDHDAAVKEFWKAYDKALRRYLPSGPIG